MDYTENYQLKKPSSADYYNIEDFNENSDIIDGKLLTGEQAYTLANQLLARVKALEGDSSLLKAKAKILLDVYAPSGSYVLISKAGYNGHSFTMGSSAYAQKELSAIGKWNISYKVNSVTYTTSVNVEHPGVTVVALAPKLEDSSWGFIDKVGQLGLAEECWSVGDTKSLTINGVSMQARILDFNHDKLWEQGTGRGKCAPITFGMTEALATRAALHSTAAENIAWGERDIFTTYFPARKAEMPSDLQSVIKRVAKVVMRPFVGETGQLAENASTYCDLLETDLFLFSERELFGESRLSIPFYEYERVYEYFARGNDYRQTGPLWLRSCGYTTSGAFKRALVISATGNVSSHEVTSQMGIWFGFCV